jgi:hypothetical protein
VAGPAEFTDTVSGARLRAIVREDEDGSRERVGWWDTKLQIECSFLLYVDGKKRCVPGYWASISTSDFGDPKCTQPIAWGDSCSQYAFTSTQACPYEYQMYQLGAPAPSWYFMSGGKCLLGGPTTSPAFFVGNPVSPDTFVSGVEVTE